MFARKVRNHALRASFALIHQADHGIIVMLLVNTLLNLSIPYASIAMLSVLIERIMANASNASLFLTLVLLSGLVLLLNLLRQATNAHIDRRKTRLYFRIFALLNEKTMKMDYQQLESPEIQQLRTRGENALRYNNGLNRIIEGMIDGVFAIVVSGLISAGSLITLVFAQASNTSALSNFTNSIWYLLVLLLLVSLPVLVATRVARKNGAQMNQGMTDIIKLNHDANYFLTDVLMDTASAPTLRAYRINNAMVDFTINSLFAKASAHIYGVLTQLAQRSAISQTITLVSVGLLYGLVGMKAQSGAISIASIVLYVGYLQNFITTLSTGIESYNNAIVMLDYLRSLSDFLDLPENTQTNTQPLRLAPCEKTPRITFEHVWFRYPGTEPWILKDLNLSFEPGQKTALVGRNGSGKTTIIKLICQFYTPTQGRILMNGQDIRMFDQRDYRKLLAVVFQDFKLFPFAIDENIAASMMVDTERMWGALSAAGMDEWVKHQINKEKTLLSTSMDEQGIHVSGGEGQKLAIARATYRQSPMVILDEPTAALDPQSEYDIYHRFDRLIENNSAIYISHRMSSCRFCERIIVLEDGAVSQDGNHEQLIVDKQGLYAKLFDTQAQYYQ